MSMRMIAPGKYVQGPGAIHEIGELVVSLGKSVLVLGDEFVLNLTQTDINTSLSEKQLSCTFEQFRGECSKVEIARVKKVAEQNKADVIVGVGGGKALDTAKAAATMLKLPIIIVPTIAATDAPTSALAVIYTENGEFEEYMFLPRNPSLVLVDTAIIAKAPVRFLVSGMGDTLSTKVEAEAAFQSGTKNWAGGSPLVLGKKIAQLSWDLILEYGVQAKIAVENQLVTPAVEKVVEANTLLSGMGFELNGTAGAHAIHNGLTILEETHRYYHGEKAGFGTLCQMVLEDRPPQEIDQLVDFCAAVGLPTKLEDLGLKGVSESKLMKVAEAACSPTDTMVNMPFPVTPVMVMHVMLAVDALGRRLAKK